MKQEKAVTAQTALFRRNGWVFLTHGVMPEIADVGTVQRFASLTTDHLHHVVIDDGLRCTCPGWRKHGKCWHVRWVLEYNVSADWRVGTYVLKMPTTREQAELDDRSDWEDWIDEHIAIVGTEESPHGPPTPLPDANPEGFNPSQRI